MSGWGWGRGRGWREGCDRFCVSIDGSSFIFIFISPRALQSGPPLSTSGTWAGVVVAAESGNGWGLRKQEEPGRRIGGGVRLPGLWSWAEAALAGWWRGHHGRARGLREGTSASFIGRHSSIIEQGTYIMSPPNMARFWARKSRLAANFRRCMMPSTRGGYWNLTI